MIQVLTFFLQRLWRRMPLLLVWLSSLLCACSIMGCAAISSSRTATLPRLDLSHYVVREVCWEPSEFGEVDKVDKDNDANNDDNYFVLAKDGTAIPSKKRSAFIWGLEPGGFVYKHNENAPIENLQFVPLSRVDVWCSGIPKPTKEAVRRLLDPCEMAALMPEGRSVAKNLFGQAENPPVRSPLFCGKQPQMAWTTEQTISILRRNAVYQTAYQQQRKNAKNLTLAKADLESVTNKSGSWLKEAFTSNPGTLEQVQQRVTDALNSIEAPPDYGDQILDELALAGFQAGYEDGEFEAEATLFAIDAGVFIVEFVAMEVALGPLGGAKFLSSAVSKGSKAMKAAVVRLGEIPIFIPGAAGGIGGFIRAAKVMKAMSRYHVRRLEKAMFAEASLRGKTLVKLATEETHHIVPPGRNLADAEECRKILAKFGVDVDHAANGVFLPANLSSPNPGGAIVHKTLGNNKAYYEKLKNSLKKATSQAELLQRLEQIGETLKNGTFFHASL